MKHPKVSLDQLFLWLLVIAVYAYLLSGIFHRSSPGERRRAEVSAAVSICYDRFDPESDQFTDCLTQTVSPLLDRDSRLASSSKE